MNKIFLPIFVALSIILLGTLYLNKKTESDYRLMNEQNIATLKDSLNKAVTISEYTKKILMLNYKIGNTSIKNAKFYKILPGGSKKEVSINDGKRKFIIRYSEIGCNTCVNLLFKHKKRLNEIKKSRDLIILVDFDNYENYIRWKRVTEFEGNIYWIKKDEIPFDSKFGESSYTFSLDEQMNTHNFFIPNNLFPQMVFSYLDEVVSSGSL